MSQKLIFGFPIPVVLAFSVMVAVLLAVARVLASMRKPPPVRMPSTQAHERIDAFQPDETPV